MITIGPMGIGSSCEAFLKDNEVSLACTELGGAESLNQIYGIPDKPYMVRDDCLIMCAKKNFEGL